MPIFWGRREGEPIRHQCPGWLVILTLVSLFLAGIWIGGGRGFYSCTQLLRGLVLITCIWCCIDRYRQEGDQADGLFFLLVVVGILYNPLFQIHLTRGVWRVLNLLSLIPFGMFLKERQ